MPERIKKGKEKRKPATFSIEKNLVEKWRWQVSQKYNLTLSKHLRNIAIKELELEGEYTLDE